MEEIYSETFLKAKPPVKRRMILTQDKESVAYKEMYERYVDLKVILTVSGVNVTELDRIKE